MARPAELLQLATQALDRAMGDQEKAAQLLRKQLEYHTTIKAALLDDLLADEIHSVLRAVAKSQRVAQTVATPDAAPPEEANAASDVTGLLLKARRAYMDWALTTSGKPLGNAKNADLELEISALKSGLEMTEHAIAWLSRVRMRLKPGQTVRQSMTEQDLISLRDAARRKTA